MAFGFVINEADIKLKKLEESKVLQNRSFNSLQIEDWNKKNCISTLLASGDAENIVFTCNWLLQLASNRSTGPPMDQGNIWRVVKDWSYVCSIQYGRAKMSSRWEWMDSWESWVYCKYQRSPKLGICLFWLQFRDNNMCCWKESTFQTQRK